mmetsp:Transcript_27165/g.59366  ORF Transcript_27165/g.59366 Transcript_27165/m.59366 type:complete len:503 (+) Transcript_27165:129-1637(+)
MLQCYLLVVEGGDTGKGLALKELKGSTTTGGDVGHLLREAGLLDGSNGVTATDDGDGVGHLGKGVSDGEGTLGEGVHLEHTHGAVPHHGLAGLQLLLERLDGVGTDIETHPAVGDGVSGGNLGGSISGELVGQQHVGGEEELHTLSLGVSHQGLGELNLVLLDQGRTDGEALSLVEGEDHATAQDQHVDALKQGLDHANLGGHLGATDDSAERALGLEHGTLKVVQLLLEEETRDRRGQELGDTLGGGVGAMGGTEGVVDVQVGVGRELLGEPGLVLGLLTVEANVLEEHHGAGGHGSDGLLDLLADAVVGLGNLALEVLLEAGHDGGQAELLGHALGTTQVGGQQNLGTVVHEELDGRDGTTDAGVISDVLVRVHRHVQVGTHEHTLAIEILLGEIGHRLLHGLNLHGAKGLGLGDRAGSEHRLHGGTLARTAEGSGLRRHAGSLGGSHSGDLGGLPGHGGLGPGHGGAESDGGGSHFYVSGLGGEGGKWVWYGLLEGRSF